MFFDVLNLIWFLFSGFNILEDKSNCFQKDLISKQKTNKLLENNLCDLQSVNSVVIEYVLFLYYLNYVYLIFNLNV